MCGRFTLHTEREVLAHRFRVPLEELSDLAPRYNVAPTQAVLVVRAAESGREALRMRWGLVPEWAKEPEKLPSMINARAETAASRPAYRVAFRRRRCLIVADGFYEWGPGEPGSDRRSPFWLALETDEPFGMAGIWSAWRPPGEPDAPPRLTCSILTVAASESVARVHDRMPAILAPEAEDRWLDPELRDPSSLSRLLAVGPAPPLRVVPVSRRVNSPRNDGPDLILPVPEPPSLGF